MASELAPVLPLDEFGVQICRGPCGKTLPLADFHPNSSMRLGVTKTCKKCQSKYAREWVEKNPEKAFNSHLLRRFGITLDEYNAMLIRQGGVCAVCGELPTSVRNRRKGKQRTFIARLVVDHDHATGMVRGLLCSSCNTGIGALKDEAVTVRAALDYLERK